MKRKLLAKIFYWLFLKKTTSEMYKEYPDGTRVPNKIGEMFYNMYHYLNQ